ncbi:mucin-2-like [Arapaima gigas]
MNSNCKGPDDVLKQPGETWESGCYICTCNNITITVECKPKPPPTPPTCKDDEMLVTFNSTDCCYMATCVKRTCEFNGTNYEVGNNWIDSENPCVSYSCEKSGTRIKEKVCPDQQCSEELRVWDEQGCCYTCKPGNQTCTANICSQCCSPVTLAP